MLKGGQLCDRRTKGSVRTKASSSKVEKKAKKKRRLGDVRWVRNMGVRESVRFAEMKPK